MFGSKKLRIKKDTTKEVSIGSQKVKDKTYHQCCSVKNKTFVFPDDLPKHPIENTDGDERPNDISLINDEYLESMREKQSQYRCGDCVWYDRQMVCELRGAVVSSQTLSCNQFEEA